MCSFLRYIGGLHDEGGLTIEQIQSARADKIFWLSCFCSFRMIESSMETYSCVNVLLFLFILASLLFVIVSIFPLRSPVDECQQDSLCSFLFRLPKFLRSIVASRGWNDLLLPTVFQQLPCEAKLRGRSLGGNYNSLWFSNIRYLSLCRCNIFSFIT